MLEITFVNYSIGIATFIYLNQSVDFPRGIILEKTIATCMHFTSWNEFTPGADTGFRKGGGGGPSDC